MAILLYAPSDTVGANSEAAEDVYLLACSLADQLSRKHAKRLVVFFGMRKDGINAIEIRPLTVFTNDADTVVDVGGSGWDKRQ